MSGFPCRVLVGDVRDLVALRCGVSGCFGTLRESGKGNGKSEEGKERTRQHSQSVM
jgi:hypothetical protein